MDTEALIKATESTKRLIQDDNYYRHIFKKTERIVSVVFYITHNIKDVPANRVQVADMETSARFLHDAVITSLNGLQHMAEEEVRKTAHALVALLSKLTVAQAAGLMTTEVLSIIENEADSVLRSMGPYLGEEPVHALVAEPRTVTRRGATGAVARPASRPVEQNTREKVSHQNRKDQIKAIMATQGEVSIKDISAVLTGISEKTIQRDLNDMIETNDIKRIGERRWSRYVLL